MLKLTQDYQIQVCLESTDMRKSIDGLLAKVVDYFEADAQSKTVFVFCNKVKDKVKILYWHRNGFAMLYKRLDRGRFKLRLQPSGRIAVSEEQLEWLLAGLDFQLMEEFNELDYRNYY
jgi:transposase